MEQQQQQPQLQGFVIISLPPPDNPSKGKTITAFAISNSHPDHLPLRPPAAAAARAPRAAGCGLRFFRKRTLAAVFGAALLLFSLWAFLSSEAPLQLLREPSDDARRRGNDTTSFLLPLYHKHRLRLPHAITRVKLASVRIGGELESSQQPRGKRPKIDISSSAAAANSSALLPLRGNIFPDGLYYTAISVGNPHRPYFLDVDTGSDLTWIQCDAPCSSCAKGPHPLYTPIKGKIVPPRDSLCLEVQSNQNHGYCDSCQQCDYEIEYADHSSSMGVLARDEMELVVSNGDRLKLGFVFGCAYDQQGQLLSAKTDGILGLSNSKVSLPSQLASQGVINNVVGHCISSEADAGGYMFLGDEFVPRWGMTWISTHADPTNFYLAEAMKLSYGGEHLTAPGEEGTVGKVVFDSGSTYTYFTNEAYTNLRILLSAVSDALVQDHSDSTLPVCWRADLPLRSVEDVKQFFQPLSFQFRKRWWIMPTTFTIPPEGYLMISDKGNVCLGILNGSEVHDGSTIVLGDISLRGKLVVYDNVQNKIGWVHSDCSEPKSPRGFPFFF